MCLFIRLYDQAITRENIQNLSDTWLEYSSDK